MRFHYPHKFYMFTFILLCCLVLYGSIVMYQIHIEGQLHIYMVFVYGAVCFFIGRFYYIKYRYFRVRYIDVWMQQLQFCMDGACIAIPLEDLDMVILARHRQTLKIHRVIHIFSKSGTYIYVTNDLTHFKRFQLLLQYYFPQHFLVTNKLIKGYHEVTLDFLLEYVDKKDLINLRK